jgi:hypothetical protein
MSGRDGLRYTLLMTRSRSVPLAILAASAIGLTIFSRGLLLSDTIGMFVCAGAAGAALAALARRR